jgi:hypothetical protein
MRGASSWRFDMDFKEMKERIKLVDVLLHYGIRLRRRFDSEYASATCPLPTHPSDDRSNNAFGVHLPSNRWQCKHPECGKKNGVGDKWGDCINLVMTLDNTGARAASIKLDGWFRKENPAPSHGESREDGRVKHAPSHHTSEPTSQDGDVKYMASIELWFDQVSKRLDGESDAEYRKRFLSALKAQLIQSYKAGQKSKAA